MRKICKAWRRGVLITVLAVAGIWWTDGGKAQAAAEPEIVGQEAVIYMDGKDEISVIGENIHSVRYTSSAQDVAKVDNAGVVTPVKQGTAKIQAEVTYGEAGHLQSKTLFYDLRVMDVSTKYFRYDGRRITGLTARGKTLKDVYIPGYHNDVKITTVWKNVFDNDTVVEKVFLSDYLEYLDYHKWTEPGCRSFIFKGCSSLKELHIGKGLKSIGYMQNISSLEKITVHPQNPNFQVKDNVLFSGNCLVYYPAGRNDTSYAMPESVTEIGEYAFSGAGRLTGVKLPAGLKSIGLCAFEKTGLEEMAFPLDINLDNGAFQDCSRLQKVMLPNKLEARHYVFKNCSSLKTVILPNTAIKVYADNFCGCSSLQAFQIADGDSSFCVSEGVLFQKHTGTLTAYPAGKKNTSYELPSVIHNIRVERIESQAFTGVAYLKKIKLHSALKSIGYGAFEDCRSLVSFRIPKKAVLMGDVTQCFWGCRSLKEITVDAQNKSYSSVKGVLFNKSKKRVYCYPQAKRAKAFTLPGSVTRIGSCSFSNTRYLQKLVMGNRVTRIDYSAFANARALKRITLSSGLKKIGDFAFENCNNLQKLTFRGKKWLNGFPGGSVFRKAGSKNYRKLTVNAPRMSKKQRAKCKKVFRKAGLSKKAKIIFAKK